MENQIVTDRYAWLVPMQPCCVCAAASRPGLCRDCWQELPVNAPACPICALPLAVALPCPACLQKTPPYARTLAPLRYEFPVSILIQRLKFHQQLHLARLLGLLLAQSVREWQMERPEVLIPMPLHRERLRSRGFNQSLLLARELSRTLRIAVDARCCQRERDTPAQIGLSARQRRQNLRGAFLLPRQIHYQHVVIVDDVITSGASMTELASVLRRAGVERVDAWALARA